MPYPFSREATAVLGRDHYSGVQITSWFDKVGPDYAKWLGSPYVPVPRDYGTNIRKAINFFAKDDPDAELPAIVVAAMIVHESAGGQSHYYKTRNNPSGIGAINEDPDQALVFETHYDGILATVARLLVYTKGDGPWVEYAPRADIIRSNGWFATVVFLKDLEQKWAFTPWEKYNATAPEKRYGGALASLMNDAHIWMATQENDRPRVPKPEFGNCVIPVGRGNRPGFTMTPQWITIHDTGNRSSGAGEQAHCTYVTTNPATEREPSWHFTVGDDMILQHLPTTEAAWHAGDGANGVGNRQSIAIEMTVDSGQDFAKALANLAHLVAYLLDQHDLGIEKVVQHNHWKSALFPAGKDCPRWLRETGRWPEFLGMVNDILMHRSDDEIVVDDPNARYYRETGHWIINMREVAMLDWFDEQGGVAVLGYPLSGMTLDQDMVYRQLFENVLAEFWPDKNTYRFGGLGQRYVALQRELVTASEGG